VRVWSFAFEKEVQWDVGSVFHSRRRIGHRLARFRQVNKGQSDVHHDALELLDGQIVLLTQLCEGSARDRAAVASRSARHR